MKKSEKNIRQLTIASLHVPRSFNKIISVPSIRICGRWLEDCGFVEGQKVNVRVETGRLVVEVE